MLRVAVIAVAAAAVLMSAGPAAAKAPRDFVGIVAEDVFAGTHAYREQVLSAHRRLGVQVIRQTFDWSDIERTPGQYDFSYYDAFVAQAAHHGIRIVPVLFRPPVFRTDAAHTDRETFPPRRATDMGRFGAAVARRYGRGGTLWDALPSDARKRPIMAYQVWNEPNLPVYWPAKPNAKEYAKLLTATSRGIKLVDRRAEIVTAGLPASKFPGAVPLIRYINQLYRAGGKRGFDTLAINTYANNSKELIKLLWKVRKTMDKRGDRQARIWASEFGWADEGPPSRLRVGSRKQAKNIGKSISAMGQNRKKLKLSGFVYWNWKDAPPYRADFDFWGLHAGLLRQDGSPKPALESFADAVRGLK